MAFEPGSINQLSDVISHMVAPAFLTGAVASFISILISRMDGVIDRPRVLNAIPAEGHEKSSLKADIPRLKRRAALLQRTHVWGTALLFVLSMGLLCASLMVLAAEVKIGFNEFDEK